MVCFAFVAIWPGLVGGSAQLVGLTGMSHLACLLPQYMLGPLGIKEIIKWEKKEKKMLVLFLGERSICLYIVFHFSFPFPHVL